MIPSLGGGPFPFVQGKGSGEQKRGDQFWREGGHRVWREHLMWRGKAGFRSPVSWLGGPQGGSPPVGPAVLTCERRAATPSKSPSVRVCGPRSCTSVQGEGSPWEGGRGPARRGGGRTWQVRAVEHRGRGLARGQRLRNVLSPPLRGALGAGQFTFQLCWNLLPVERGPTAEGRVP